MEECLICARPLRYDARETEARCAYCGGVFFTRVRCEAGHYICDRCHAAQGVELICRACEGAASRNPVEIAQSLMAHPSIHMHGNEHHVLVGAALIAACANAGAPVQRSAALAEMARRGREYPGGACGFWGCCGAAASAGMAFSILTGATPLSAASWGQANRLTGRILEAIGALGGPRCCKRNSFTALRVAAQFLREECSLPLEVPEQIRCGHSARNAQCLREKCPYFAG